jgi:hypothetical protein
MADIGIYRNERIPPYHMVQRIKQVCEDLYVVWDSVSSRWHVWYKDANGQPYLVYRVAEKDEFGRDAGYRPLDDRTIKDLLRYDMGRRNISNDEYLNRVRDAEDERDEKDKKRIEEYNEHVYKQEASTLKLAYDAYMRENRS